ncbi:MAG TPA: hypothetical protein VM677_02785 [Actinokineospora sp.]|nr:hypothetical protein [Actinokineospora sp.]
MHPDPRDAAECGRIRRGKGRAMADLAYALLLIGIFLVLALTVRGLEKL